MLSVYYYFISITNEIIFFLFYFVLKLYEKKVQITGPNVFISRLRSNKNCHMLDVTMYFYVYLSIFKATNILIICLEFLVQP